MTERDALARSEGDRLITRDVDTLPPDIIARAWPIVGVPAESATVLTTHRMKEEGLDNAWRRDSVTRLLSVFYWVNGFVLGFMFLVWVTEAVFPKAPQILTERSLLSLIAGSTVQLGALALFVGRALAPPTRGGGADHPASVAAQQDY